MLAHVAPTFACARWWFEELSVFRLVDPVRVSFSPQNLQGFLSPSLSHFLAVSLAYRNTVLYLHTAPRKLTRQPNRCSKERVRNEDESSLICKRRMTKELKLAVPRFQKNLFSLLFSHFLYQKIPPSSRQSHSQFPLVPVSRSTSCKRNSSGMQLKRSLHGSESGKKGVRGAVWNGEWRSLPPFLSRSVTLSSLPTSPDRRAIAQLFENTANHSLAANGERMRQDLDLSLMHSKNTLHYLVRVTEGNTTVTATHKKNNNGYLRENLIHTHKDIRSELY